MGVKRSMINYWSWDNWLVGGCREEGVGEFVVVGLQIATWTCHSGD